MNRDDSELDQEQAVGEPDRIGQYRRQMAVSALMTCILIGAVATIWFALAVNKARRIAVEEKFEAAARSDLVIKNLIDAFHRQTALEVDSASFEGMLHNNLSNKRRQGSGLNPLILKSYPGANLYRDDAVGVNFEHIFNGAKDQRSISGFTPRQDPCLLSLVGENQYEIYWPSETSKWEMEARMHYDLSKEGQVDLVFECTPRSDIYPQGFVAMMWASYMNRTYDRRIHFWGTDGDRTGWVAFGENSDEDLGFRVVEGFEFGAVSHVAAATLQQEEGVKDLNLIERDKKFITPFYYGIVDGDHDLETKSDKLLYLVLFDQTDAIRFALWNLFVNENGDADTHSPAWDWQYVIRDPVVGQRYGYRARVVVKPFEGTKQIWDEYRRWGDDLGVELPDAPSEK